jgi:hypothetical protein
MDQANQVQQEAAHPILLETKGIILLIFSDKFSDKEHAIAHASYLHAPLLFPLKADTKFDAALEYSHPFSEDHILRSLWL